MARASMGFMVAISSDSPAAYSERSTDVVVLRWPEQSDRANRLDRWGIPHLLLIDPGVEPPESRGCLDDWLRLPADDVDLRARCDALARRAARHVPMPHLDEFGQLSYRGLTVFLSPNDHRFTEALLEHFSSVVDDAELVRRTWPGGGKRQQLRVHASRLRRRIEPVGLTVARVRNAGYLMRESSCTTAPYGSSMRPRRDACTFGRSE